MKIQLSDHYTYKRLFKFVFPSIFMMIFTSIYVVVDGFFVSNFAGETAFAALNLVMPFVMILGGTGFMIGTGGSALVSKILGEGNRDKAKKYFSVLIYFTLALGCFLTIIGLLVVRPISSFLGAKGEMLEDCVIYGSVVIAFTASYMLQNVFQSFLVVSEKPKLGLLITIISGLSNILLDALFIGVFKWGLIGAAIATGIGQVIGGIIPLIYFLRPNSSTLNLVRTRLYLKPIVKACTNGMSEFLNNISSSIIGMIFNFQLMRLLGQDGVSAYGVVLYVQFIFLAISLGYSVGSAPIISYNYGNGNTKELKNILKKSLIFMSASGIGLMIIAQLLADPLSNMFVGYNRELHDITVHAFRLFSFSFVIAGINIYASSFFTSLNNGIISAAISFLRTFIFQVVFVIVLPIFLGVDGVWISVPLAEICSFILSVYLLTIKRKKYHY